MLETVLRSLMYRAVLYEVDYYFRARVIQMKMWIFYEPSERVDTRWRKSFQIKCTYFDDCSQKPKNMKIFITIKAYLNFILISFLYFYICDFSRYCCCIWRNSFNVGQNQDSWSCVHCLRHREPCQNFPIFAKKNGEKTDNIHILSLFLSPLPQSLRYSRLSLILPSCTLSLLLPPPRVRVTAVFREARKLVDTRMHPRIFSVQ